MFPSYSPDLFKTSIRLTEFVYQDWIATQISPLMFYKALEEPKYIDVQD